MWTIQDVAERNRSGGFYYFSPKTMKAFGDSLSSFKVHEDETGVYVVRIKASKCAPAGYNWREKAWARFNPITGHVGVWYASKDAILASEKETV